MSELPTQNSGTFHATINALRESELQLKKSEERFYKMVEEVEDYAILLLNEQGIIENWNAGAEKIKGYKESEILGKHFRIFYLKEDQDNKLPEQLIHEAVKNGKAIHEGWRVRKDGTTFWGSIVITALHDKEHNIIGFSKVTRDLSERKLKDDQISQYTSDLERQNKELEQFAYAASHDLKEPLRKIQFYISAIAENASAVLDDKTKGYLDRTIHSAQRMQKLIEDILTYAKTSSRTDQFTLVDLNEIVTDLSLLHKDEIELQSIHIHFDKLPTTLGVSFQLKQLFDNLISNAIKYKHPKRHSVINIHYEMVSGKEISFDGPTPELSYHKISITDNGIGFEAIYADRIFEIFQRLEAKNDSSGSGVGLAICKKIIQNHHGFITASGETDHGARFDIFLPA